MNERTNDISNEFSFCHRLVSAMNLPLTRSIAITTFRQQKSLFLILMCLLFNLLLLNCDCVVFHAVQTIPHIDFSCFFSSSLLVISILISFNRNKKLLPIRMSDEFELYRSQSDGSYSFQAITLTKYHKASHKHSF